MVKQGYWWRRGGLLLARPKLKLARKGSSEGEGGCFPSISLLEVQVVHCWNQGLCLEWKTELSDEW